MPVSRILDDGRVEIYNTKTGEVKQVLPDELRTYNPAMVGEYLKLKNTAVTPQEELSNVKAQKELELIKSGQAPEVEGTAQQEYSKKAALNAINELETLYGRGSAENVGTESDLSLSKSPSGLGKTMTKIGRGLGKMLGTNKKLTEDINIYKGQTEMAISALTQALGSGAPQDTERLAILSRSIPNEYSTDREAKAWFQSVKNILGEKKKINNEVGTETSLQNQITQTTQQLEPATEEDKDGFLKKLTLGLADIAPGAGGILGGLTGGVLGGGLMSALTGASGAGIGYGGGKVVQNAIRDLLGEQEKAPAEQLKEAGVGMAKEAASDLAGFGVGQFILKPIAKGGGYVLKSLVKNIDDIPLKSVRFNPSQLTNFTKKHGDDVAEFMVKRGYLGDEALEIAYKDAAKIQSTFDNLALNKNMQIPVDELAKRFSTEITELAGKGERIVPNVNKQLAEGLLKEWQSVLEQLKRQGRNMVGVGELTMFRRDLDELIPKSAFIEQPVKNLSLRLRKMFNDVVYENVDKRLLTDVAGGGELGTLKNLGTELSKLYDFLEMTEKQSNLGRGSLVTNLTRILTGGGGGTIGAVVGGVPGAVVGGSMGLASEALLRDPNVLKSLYKSGKVVQPIVNKQLPRFIQSIPQVSATLTQLLGKSVQ